LDAKSTHFISVLANQGVQAGDLFIFWGLFRPVENVGRWQFVGKPEHRIWGWLQIADIIELGADGSHAVEERPWLSDHPTQGQPQLGVHLGFGIVAAIINATIGALMLLFVIRLVRGRGGWRGSWGRRW
jgi:Nucleotide modification associated domain 3